MTLAGPTNIILKEPTASTGRIHTTSPTTSIVYFVPIVCRESQPTLLSPTERSRLCIELPGWGLTQYNTMVKLGTGLPYYIPDTPMLRLVVHIHKRFVQNTGRQQFGQSIKRAPEGAPCIGESASREGQFCFICLILRRIGKNQAHLSSPHFHIPGVKYVSVKLTRGSRCSSRPRPNCCYC